MTTAVAALVVVTFVATRGAGTGARTTRTTRFSRLTRSTGAAARRRRRPHPLLLIPTA
ncbi:MULTISPECIES: hypothetical protein [unclassified Streptomyces]|uniref:hypothetical protein n=1 Tax=unclassified Streptomyces TaxID=2593676 RepID=UPI0033BE5FFB